MTTHTTPTTLVRRLQSVAPFALALLFVSLIGVGIRLYAFTGVNSDPLPGVQPTKPNPFDSLVDGSAFFDNPLSFCEDCYPSFILYIDAGSLPGYDPIPTEGCSIIGIYNESKGMLQIPCVSTDIHLGYPTTMMNMPELVDYKGGKYWKYEMSLVCVSYSPSNLSEGDDLAVCVRFPDDSQWGGQRL